MKKIFVCEYIGKEIYAFLSERFEIVSEWDRLNEVEGLITRNFKVTADMMDKAEKLRVIGVFGTGMNSVDLAAAKQRNIDVFSAPGQNAYSVAELIISLMLDISKRVTVCDRLIRQGKITHNAPLELIGCDLRGKTLGLIGTGNIAAHTAKIARDGFGMRVIGWSAHFTQEKADKMGIEYAAGLAEIMSLSDYVSISVPLTDSTRGLVSRDMLSLMKPTAFLINTARGAVIDEDALYDMLKEGKIAGAACDVFNIEPPTADNRLFSLDNFVGTPHIGDNTEDAVYRVGRVIADGMAERLI